MLSLSIGLSASTLAICAVSDSFPLFVTLRVLEGCFSAAISRILFALLNDYFPISKRTQSNSFVQVFNQLGQALSSFSILFISAYGWRDLYFAIGAAGMTVSGLTFSLVKEPARGRFIEGVVVNEEIKQIPGE